MTEDHSLKPEKLMILSEAELALPQCLHKNTWSWTCGQAVCTVGGRPGGREGQSPGEHLLGLDGTWRQ